MKSTQQRNLEFARQAYQYSILRYVQDIERDEPRNIGVVVRSMDRSSIKVCLSERSKTWSKLDPSAKSLALNMRQQLEKSVRESSSLGRIGKLNEEEFFAKALNEFTGHLQFTEPRGILSESIEAAVQQVFNRLVLPQVDRRVGSRKVIAQSEVRRRVWSAFQQEDMFSKRNVHKEFVIKGQHAKWTFDIGYEKGYLSLINSLALTASEAEMNLDRALILAGMINDVKNAANADIKGAAVVASQNESGRSSPGLKGAQDILKDASIEVVPLNALPNYVGRVRTELELAN